MAVAFPLLNSLPMATSESVGAPENTRVHCNAPYRITTNYNKHQQNSSTRCPLSQCVCVESSINLSDHYGIYLSMQALLCLFSSPVCSSSRHMLNCSQSDRDQTLQHTLPVQSLLIRCCGQGSLSVVCVCTEKVFNQSYDQRAEHNIYSRHTLDGCYAL